MKHKLPRPLHPLRNLMNDNHLPDSGGVRTSPHGLSEVLSGALYTIIVKMHENCKETFTKK